MLKFLGLLSGIAAALVGQPAAARPQAPVAIADLIRRIDIPYQRFTLPNGLRVVVHTDRKAPIVAVSIWYDIGSKHEPAGKTGFAHLFEHLMFNGSENNPGDFYEPLRAMGATDTNGSTYFDRTNYFETVPTGALERTLFLESDRMGHLLGALTQTKLDRQRGVVQNEKRQGDNQPYGLVQYAQLENLLPPGHPYAHTTIGSMADLDGATLDDVKGWFRSNYGASNAVVVLAGDIDVATARPLMAKYFGDIPAGRAVPDPVVTIPTLPARKDVVLTDRVANTRLIRSWAVPGLTAADSVPLNIFADVLGGLPNARLAQVLVRDTGLASGVSASVQNFEQIGFFQITVNLRPGADVAAVSAAIDRTVADLIRTGPTVDEIRRVATRLTVSEFGGLEQVGGFAGKAVTLAEGELYSRDPGSYKAQLARYAATTPADVRRAGATWLSRPPLTIVVEPGARPAYAETQSAGRPAAGTAAQPPETVTPGTKRMPMPAVGAIGALSFPPVVRGRLKNGIEIVYARRTTIPITQATLNFDVGTVADVAGAPGTLGMVIAALTSGAGRWDVVTLAERQDRLGAMIGGSSGADRTSIGLMTPSPNLAAAVELYADVVRRPTFPLVEVERVKRQRLAYIASAASDPGALAETTMAAALYGTASPYAKLAAGYGDAKAVAALTPADLATFQRAWLRPEKARLFVVSDLPFAQVKAAFDTGFGDWHGIGPAGGKPVPATPKPATPRIILVDRPDAPQSVIVGAQLTPLRGTDNLLPLGAANDVLGGNFLSRLNLDLRETRGWSYGVSSQAQRHEYVVPFAVRTSVQADRTGDALRVMRDDIRSFLTTNGVTRAEFDQTIEGMIRELPGSFEAAGSVVGAMLANDFAKRADDYQTSLARRYRALTPGDLDAAARSSLDPDRFVWVVVGDAARIRPQLETLGLPVENAVQRPR